MIGVTERGDASIDTSWLHWTETNKAILITKNPLKLFEILNNNKKVLDNIIVHATITGLPKEIEPNVPFTNAAVYGVEQLLTILPKERIVIRIDPIIPMKSYIGHAIHVYNKTIHLNIPRYRISFLDAYQHVRTRFNTIGFNIPWEGLHAPLNVRYIALKMLNIPNVEICGEPGLECTGCISIKDLQTFGIKTCSTKLCGQRTSCKCLAEKKELLSNKHPCTHGCLYCYWQN
jgi:hypothetical protein